MLCLVFVLRCAVVCAWRRRHQLFWKSFPNRMTENCNAVRDGHRRFSVASLRIRTDGIEEVKQIQCSLSVHPAVVVSVRRAQLTKKKFTGATELPTQVTDSLSSTQGEKVPTRPDQSEVFATSEIDPDKNVVFCQKLHFTLMCHDHNHEQRSRLITTPNSYKNVTRHN